MITSILAGLNPVKSVEASYQNEDEEQLAQTIRRIWGYRAVILPTVEIERPDRFEVSRRRFLDLGGLSAWMMIAQYFTQAVPMSSERILMGTAFGIVGVALDCLYCPADSDDDQSIGFAGWASRLGRVAGAMGGGLLLREIRDCLTSR